MTELLTDSEIEEIVQIDKAIRHCWEDILERTDWDIETRDEHRNIAKWLEELKTSRETISRQKTEIERLQEKYDRTMDNLKAVLDERADHTEAVKEVLERLKDKSEDCTDWGQPYVLCRDIDELLEELTHQPTKIEHNSLCETETYESR